MRVLDSDHCVELLRGRLDLSRRAEVNEVFSVTSITVGELVYGAQRSTRREYNLARIEVLLAPLFVLPFDDTAARRFGLLKADLERNGQRLDDLDLQIAAICLVTNSVLLTHNTRHFRRIEGLTLEDWLT